MPPTNYQPHSQLLKCKIEDTIHKLVIFISQILAEKTNN